MSEGMYRHSLPALNLSIERLTENVPCDGKYYVLRDGETVGVFRSLKQATRLFRQIVDESGYKPEEVSMSKEALRNAEMNRYFEAKELYWAESHKYRGGGGRGGRGGV